MILTILFAILSVLAPAVPCEDFSIDGRNREWFSQYIVGTLYDMDYQTPKRIGSVYMRFCGDYVYTATWLDAPYDTVENDPSCDAHAVSVNGREVVNQCSGANEFRFFGDPGAMGWEARYKSEYGTQSTLVLYYEPGHAPRWAFSQFTPTALELVDFNIESEEESLAMFVYLVMFFVSFLFVFLYFVDEF